MYANWEYNCTCRKAMNINILVTYTMTREFNTLQWECKETNIYIPKRMGMSIGCHTTKVPEKLFSTSFASDFWTVEMLSPVPAMKQLH